jgi:hypothetical protein
MADIIDEMKRKAQEIAEYAHTVYPADDAIPAKCDCSLCKADYRKSTCHRRHRWTRHERAMRHLKLCRSMGVSTAIEVRNVGKSR